MYRVIGTRYVHSGALLRKSTHILTLVTVTYRFGALLNFGALMQKKHLYNPTFWGTCSTPPVCQAAGTVSLAAAPLRE